MYKLAYFGIVQVHSEIKPEKKIPNFFWVINIWYLKSEELNGMMYNLG